MGKALDKIVWKGSLTSVNVGWALRAPPNPLLLHLTLLYLPLSPRVFLFSVLHPLPHYPPFFLSHSTPPPAITQ
ncbi:hypothetical protein FKM82_020797 [Ascaphus truei]